MKRNNWAAIALLTIALAGFAVAYFRAQAWHAKRNLAMLTEKHTVEIAAAKQAVEALRARAAEFRLEAQAAREAAEEARRLEQRAREEIGQRLEEVRIAQPHELVVEARRILGTEEVGWDGERFVFSLAAMRAGVGKWAEGEVFVLRVEPALRAQLQAKDSLIASLEGALTVKDEIIAHKDMQIQAQEAISKALRGYIARQGQEGLFKRLFWMAGGYGFGKGMEAAAKIIGGLL